MGTDQRRLDKAESSLTPREVVALWVQGLAKFDSLQGFVSWMTDDSSRAPLGRMLQQIRKGIPRRSGVRGRDESRELSRRRSGEVVFLFHLLFGVNEHVREFLSRGQSRIAALTAGIQVVNERVRSGMAMFESWKGLADTPYPLDPGAAAAVSSALRNEVTSFDNLALEIADWLSNHFADQVTNEEGLSETACERLERSAHDLCRSGFVKRGWRVRLGPSPIEFLANPPLVDGEWIDLIAVEHAEFAAIFRERGIELEMSADPHPLAPLRPRRGRKILGEPEAEALSEDEIGDARAEAAARLSTFTGRTREIDARPYIHLDDYRTWSERKAGDDLEVSEGVVTASWNAWVEARGDNPELAGIHVGKLNSYVKEDDFFSCNDPERRRRREERASLIRSFIIDNGVSKLEGLLQAYRVGICSLLTEVRAIVTATERVASLYFSGLKILFKSYASALDELAEHARLLADDYNALADYIKGEDGVMFGAGFAGRVEKIDQNAGDQAAEEAAASTVKDLIIVAKAEMLSFLDENIRAAEILKPIIRREAAQI